MGVSNVGTGYTWTNDNSSIGLPLTGSDDILNIAMTNTSNVSQVATIVVTPTFDNGGISCTGPSKTFTITINPAAQVNPISSQVVCNGDSTTSILFSTSNTSGTTTYSWTNDNTSIGLAAAGSADNIGSFPVTNTSTIPQVATLVVTPTYTFNGKDCTGSPCLKTEKLYSQKWSLLEAICSKPSSNNARGESAAKRARSQTV